MKQINAVTVGTRKLITVESEMFKYDSESGNQG